MTKRLSNRELAEKMKGEAPPLCACGCGERVKWHRWRNNWNTYIVGHNRREKRLSEEVKRKIGEASRGRKRSSATRSKMSKAQQLRRGDPVKRFWSKVDRSEGPEACWIWQTCRTRHGYGQVCFEGRVQRAHRIAYQLKHPGEDISGKVIRHRCDNPSCCNPEHLTVGTQQDNISDMVSKGRQARGDTLRSNRIFLRGEASGNAKLNEEQVKEIRSLAATGLHRKKIAEKFNVHKDTISDIIRRKTWKHI